ncbi:hypothetical protein RUND412_002820 [Rhizina undulata]
MARLPTITPQAGLTFPDFNTGDVLYLTYSTRILTGSELESIFPRVRLAVEFRVDSGKFLLNALPIRESVDSFRGLSPYNPPIRFLSSEKKPLLSQPQQDVIAKLIAVKKITKTISKFTFSLPEEVSK